jgi:GH25 family lysozyme M1 (1,4-beta-N-acetylmuramidase)
MSNALYIDISSWQPENFNWAAFKVWSAAGDGTSRVCLRVDQGVNTPDALFAAHYANAKAAGIQQFIFYHYAYPGINPNWAGAQAEVTSFLSHLGSRLGPDDLVMLDYEEAVAPAEWAYDWLHLCSEDAKIPTNRVAVYASLSYVGGHLQDSRLPAFPLIVADWTFDPNSRPAAPHPWTSYMALQYTDKLTGVAGVPEAVDANVFLHEPSPPTPPGPDLAKITAYLNLAMQAIQEALAQLGG